MAGKSTDRKAKSKDQKVSSELTDNLAAFTLPDSLPCSEVDFPVLIKRRPRANWKDIVEESNKWHKQVDEYAESKKEPIPKPPFLSESFLNYF